MATKKSEIAAQQAEPETGLTAYKGFDASLQCRGYQYEVGKTFIHTGTVSQCNSGFHACQNPLDVLDYYPLINDSGQPNRFARVTVGSKIDRSDDKKWAAAELTVNVELTVPEFIRAGIAWIMDTCKADKATGTVSSKKEDKLAASGDYSQLAASGDYSQLAASGDSSQLAASGDSSKLAASGDSSKLAASGDYSQLAASGDYSQLAASGDSSQLAESGYSSQLAASGYSSQLAASGDYSQLAASGYSSQLAASGDSSKLAASGDSSKLAASGDYSKLEVSGAKSAAAAVGPGSSIKATAGTPIAICEYDDTGAPIAFAAGIVGQAGIPADTWLVARGGKLVEA